MEARIFKLQDAAKNYQLQSYDDIRQASLCKELENRKLDRINYLLKQIPLRFREKTFSSYLTVTVEQARAKALAERYVDTFKERLAEGAGMIFKGHAGTGKTLLALLIYQSLAQDGFRVRYESTLEFIRELIEVKFKSQSTFRNYIEAFGNIDLLIIDEVTESISKDGSPNELEKQILFQIINYRYERKLCTLVIINRDTDGLLARLGDPIVDRLSENGLSIAFDWPSFRRR